MTENDIKGNFAAIRELANQFAGADLPPGEQQVVRTLTTCGLVLLEGLLLDINRIANLLENYVDLAQMQARDANNR